MIEDVQAVNQRNICLQNIVDGTNNSGGRQIFLRVVVAANDQNAWMMALCGAHQVMQ